MPKPLTPPDRKRCQAERHTQRYSFMTLGPIPPRQRCDNTPITVVAEKNPDESGQQGSMSLCGPCLTVFLQEQNAADYTFEELHPVVKTTKGTVLPTVSGRFSHAHPNLSALPKKA